VAGTLLKAIVGAEFFDEEWHPIVTKDASSTDNAAVRVTMCRRGTILNSTLGGAVPIILKHRVT
jgi:hypothetical protein